MNASEAIILQKIVEHMNVIRQYSSILHQKTYNEIFVQADFDRMFEIDDLRQGILKMLEKRTHGMLMLDRGVTDQRPVVPTDPAG